MHEGIVWWLLNATTLLFCFVALMVLILLGVESIRSQIQENARRIDQNKMDREVAENGRVISIPAYSHYIEAAHLLADLEVFLGSRFDKKTHHDEGVFDKCRKDFQKETKEVVDRIRKQGEIKILNHGIAD